MELLGVLRWCPSRSMAEPCTSCPFPQGRPRHSQYQDLVTLSFGVPHRGEVENLVGLGSHPRLGVELHWDVPVKGGPAFPSARPVGWSWIIHLRRGWVLWERRREPLNRLVPRRRRWFPRT